MADLPDWGLSAVTCPVATGFAPAAFVQLHALSPHSPCSFHSLTGEGEGFSGVELYQACGAGNPRAQVLGAGFGIAPGVDPPWGFWIWWSGHHWGWSSLQGRLGLPPWPTGNRALFPVPSLGLLWSRRGGWVTVWSSWLAVVVPPRVVVLAASLHRAAFCACPSGVPWGIGGGSRDLLLGFSDSTPVKELWLPGKGKSPGLSHSITHILQPANEPLSPRHLPGFVPGVRPTARWWAGVHHRTHRWGHSA